MVSVHGVGDKRPKAHWLRDGVYAAAGLTGLIGTGFHIFNVLKKPGGFSWQNLFYSAPIGAPAALILSGVSDFGRSGRATTPRELPLQSPASRRDVW